MSSKPETTYGNRICWIDVETTDLRFEDPTTRLLEVGVAITDLQLRPVAETDVLIRYTLEELFGESNWNPVAADMHIAQRGGSGLAEDCVFSDTALELREAEQRLLLFVAQHTDVDLTREIKNPGAGCSYPDAPLWGGCSPLIDRMMIRRDMPRLYERIHYRTLDASTLREALRQWTGRKTERAHEPHRALEDALAASKLANVFRRQVLELTSTPVVASE